jgi:hypothetical protein
MSLFHHEGHMMKHFHAKHGDGWVVLKWQAHDALEEWKVLRSRGEFAQAVAEADDPKTGQRVVFEGRETDIQDTDVEDEVEYFYTVFGREPGSEWIGQAEVKVTPRGEASWSESEAEHAKGHRLGLQAMGSHLT